MDMFHTRYVSRVQRERLPKSFFGAKATTESMMEITRKFTEMAMFFPDFASEQA